jgi:iron-sulfur cluster repair protein YtfE (RIC family)
MKPDIDRKQEQIIVRAEHIILSHGIETVRRLFRGDRPPDAEEQFASIQRLITGKIVEHLAFEEDRLFPLLLAGNPSETTIQMIAALRHEHDTLLKRVQQLQPLLHHCSITKCTGALWMALLDFVTDVGKHIAKEELLFELLFPCAVTQN